MKLTTKAERLLERLKMMDQERLEAGSNLWRRKMNEMSDESARAFFELFEELESEGFLCMSIEEQPGKPPAPRKVRVKSERNWE